jgi:hypothetical protein
VIPLSKYSLTTPDGRLRLPVWAQHQVRDLLAENRALRESLDAAVGDPDDSEAVATSGHGISKVDLPLGRHVTVTWHDNYVIRYDKDSGGIVITTFDGDLIVVPRAANTVIIRCNPK